MISICQNHDVYEIRFSYDATLVSMIKEVPGRRWNADKKYWTVPRDKLGFFLAKLHNTPYESQVNIQSEEHLWENYSLDSTTCIPNIDVSDLSFYIEEGKSPYPHQLDFMRYAVYRQHCGNLHGFLLGDDPGLGKTLETLNLAMYNKSAYGFKHCLIICCINASKYNWADDISKHLNGLEQGYILGGRKRRNRTDISYDTGNAERLQDLQTFHMYGDMNSPELPYFIITNIESIRAKSGRKYPIADEIIKLVQSGKISMIAVDEIHKNASPTSLQGKQLLRIKKAVGNKVMWLPITGTPIVKAPTDAYLPMKLIDAHRFNSYYTWCKEFCVYGGFGGHEIIGYKNVDKIKSMVQANMLRRLKSEVLPDLPDKLFYTEYVENTPYQKKLEAQCINMMIENQSEILSASNPLVKFLKLRQVNGSPELVDPSCKLDANYIKYNAKFKRLLELIDDIYKRGEKVIVFSNWVEPLRTLYRYIHTRWKTCVFTGTMSEAERQKHKKVFINNPEYTVLLGTIGAMGTTHSFPGVQNEIFYDTPWNYVDRQQAEDRIHGIGRGSGSAVNYYTLMCKNTVDERVWNIMYDKKDIASYIVDGKLDIKNNPELFMKLLGR